MLVRADKPVIHCVYELFASATASKLFRAGSVAFAQFSSRPVCFATGLFLWCGPSGIGWLNSQELQNG